MTRPGFAVVAGLMVLAGCTSASRVDSALAETSAYAPANEEHVDGEVAYLDAGARAVRNARREDAYKKMHSFCGGDYVIVREEGAESANVLALGGPQRRIFFRCVAASEAPHPAGG